MKRLLALLAILLISQVGYGQQKMDQLFNAFRGESDVTSVNIGNITMKLASLFTETMGVNGIEILEFDNCAQEVKDRMSWNEIARHVKYSESHCKKLRNNAIDKIKNII